MEPVLKMNAVCKNRYTVFFLSSHPTQLAQNNKLIQTILNCKQKLAKNGKHIFEIAQVCKQTGKTSAEVEKELIALQDNGEIKFIATDEAFSFQILRNISAEEEISLTNLLLIKMRGLEANTLWKIDEMFKLAQLSTSLSLLNPQSEPQKQYRQLQQIIQNYISDYFDNNNPKESNYISPLITLGLVKTLANIDSSAQLQIKEDVSTLLKEHGIETLSNGKIIARILHGLQSPCFESEQWKQKRFWGRYRFVDFPTLETLCTHVLMVFKTK
jgi:hypothetical protein